jgi:RimJ/RimL family protein N-acetyltransferase
VSAAAGARGEIVIRALRADDVESFHGALDRVARERRFLALTQAPPLDETRRFVEASLAAGDVHRALLVDARLIGWCDIRRSTRPSEAHSGVLGMGLLPEFRNRGLGRRLLDAALEGADAAGLARVALSVRVDNARAIALYERAGFAHEGVNRRALLIDGVFHDRAAMARLA